MGGRVDLESLDDARPLDSARVANHAVLDHTSDQTASLLKLSTDKGDGGRLHLELSDESLKEEGTRSSHATVRPRACGWTTKPRQQERGQTGRQWDETSMASTMSQAGDALGVCYRKRDHGKCDRPNCPYNHNAKAIAAARAEERRSSKGSGDGKGKHGSAPNHACGEKGGQSRLTTPDGHRK